MIVLDTHIWYWWTGNSPKLTSRHRELIEAAAEDGLVVSVISCWEIAKKTQIGKLDVDHPVAEWLEYAVSLPAVRLFPFTPAIVVEACQLPGDFHRDPADELIVATSRILKIPLLTADAKILAYQHVSLLT